MHQYCCYDYLQLKTPCTLKLLTGSAFKWSQYRLSMDTSQPIRNKCFSWPQTIVYKKYIRCLYKYMKYMYCTDSVFGRPRDRICPWLGILLLVSGKIIHFEQCLFKKCIRHQNIVDCNIISDMSPLQHVCRLATVYLTATWRDICWAIWHPT